MARPITLGVVADTHVPDHMAALPPALWEALAGVDAILHAGDICVPRVLTALEQVAPVYAVAGNRDLLLRLPLDRVLTFGGVRLGLTHGHGGWRQYAPVKVRADYAGTVLLVSHDRAFLDRVRQRFTDVEVIVFGHSHRPVNERRGGVLLFNPGSLGPAYYAPHGPAIGRLVIADGAVQATLIPVPIPGAVIETDQRA